MSFSSRAETITLTVGEYPPLDSQFLPYFGLIPHIVSEAFALENIDVEYIFLPWARAYSESRKGKVNGTLQWLYSEERAENHFYSNALLEESNVWFHLKDKPFTWETFADLKGKKIGARIGFTYSPEFYQAIDDGVFEALFLSSTLQNLKMLYSRRIDAYIENLDVGYYGVREFYDSEKAKHVTHHKKALLTNSSHLLFSKRNLKSDYFLKKFNRGLKRLKFSGRYQEIVNESRQLEPK